MYLSDDDLLAMYEAQPDGMLTRICDALKARGYTQDGNVNNPWRHEDEAVDSDDDA